MATSNSVYEGPLHRLARSAWQSLLVIGILSVIVGIVVLVWPGPTLVVAGILFGIYLLVSGILQLVAAFGPHVSTGWRVLSLISGVLSFILAFFCFRSIGDAVVLLALWIGISWMFRGIAGLVAGIEAPPGLPGRGWSIFFGIVLILGGIALFTWPIHSIATLTLVVGWWLIFIGIMDVVYAFGVRSAAKNSPGQL
ncbi:HdeD family acid-resistance protein [Nocardia sp. CDC159]|uniref:HdeD family acid-resistance protein n=1 Tax=Nocardia pulmonis TaxID=2951408 RepID=A0A9X2IZU2_9NOCA|nr:MULTISPECIES: HdeD family acid-resistance protein [Nocardia]MCM6776425.1 HdeD family acid-resistance protein [Nocardia pulmonis]MCM6788849.1 HdeD family acid-resistance protein [Nocardia sp. CDC159]